MPCIYAMFAAHCVPNACPAGWMWLELGGEQEELRANLSSNMS